MTRKQIKERANHLSHGLHSTNPGDIHALPEILSALADGAIAEEVKISVKVYGYVLNQDEDGFEANANATGKVIVKGFTKTGEILPVQEIPVTLGSDGTAIVDVTANVGDTIGVMAKITNSGATCQMVQKVTGDVVIPIESYPVGLWEIGDGSINAAAGEDMYNGLVVVSADFALALTPHQRSGWKSEYVQWGGMFQNIPFVMKAASDTEAITDFDGALNTAAILSVVDDAKCAAKVATDMGDISYSRINPFLPSAGMLKYLYDHLTEINTFIAAETTAYEPDTDYDLLPTNNAWWSSTDRDLAESNDLAAYAWYVLFNNGYVYRSSRLDNSYGLSVSAFQFVY